MTHRYTPAFFLLPALLFASALPAQCPITVDAGEDIYLCAPPSPTQLHGSISGDYLNFNWSPTSGMSGSNTLTPTVNVSQNTSYVLTANAVDFNNNLISNGDFESGNTDFTSDYVYSPGDLWPEGTYDVINNPQADHANFAPCQDHTSGGGNMMVVNGAGVANINVWCQTVIVTPNTQYVFSAWLASVVSSSPAQLQFNINGSPIGAIFGPPSQTCQWVNFYTTWNSGASSSATICIVNKNTALSGNDFAMDDIVFAPVCQVKDTVKVNIINITAAASPAVSFIPCDGANITLSGTGSSTGPNITYNWDSPNGNIVSGGNTLSPVVNSPGVYTLTVTYDNGLVTCTKTATVNVTLSPNQLIAWINPPQPIGCGSATVTLIGNTNQPAFATYQWTASNGGNIVSGQNNKNAVVDAAGTYELLVTNTNTGCTAVTQVTVTSATNPPAANAAAGDTITCLQSTTSLSGAGSSTGSNISYAWTTPNGIIVSGQNALNAVAGAGGIYILAVTNTSNNCTSRDTVTVTANMTAPTVGIQPPGILDCDTDTLTLSATATPAGASIVWSGNIVSGQNTLTPQLTTAGPYALTATNPANGCTAGASVTVTSNYTPPVAAVQPADTLTCQQSGVTLSGSGSSAGANFTYLWTASPGGNIVSGQNTLNPVVNASGVYTLLVTNVINACTASASVPVAADTNIVVAVANAPDTLSCAADTVALNTNGSSSIPTLAYSWTTADGNITGGANTPNPTANAPGTYQLVLTNTANGCSATDIAVVAQNTAAPNVQIAPPDTITCANPTQNLQAQNLSLPGSFAYVWAASNGGNIVSGDSTLNPVINAAGNYILTTTNLTNGCASSDTVVVAVETGTPVAIAASPGPLTCVQTVQTLSSAGSSTGANFTYLWTSTDGHISSGAHTPNPVVDQPGNYNLLITNISNGCTAATSAIVTQNIDVPDAVINTPPVLTCSLPQFYLVSDGTGDPTWSTIGGNIVSGGGEYYDCLIDAPGLYILTTLNTTNGCTASDTVQVIANQQQPSLNIAPPAVLTCLQTSVALSATAAGNSLAYQWQTAGGQFVSGQTGASPVVDAPGTYSLTITDGVNGCTNTASVAVSEDAAQPNVQITAPGTVTCAHPTQIIQAQNLSLPGNFTYLWTSASGGNIISGNNTLTAGVDAGGDYALNVINLTNGCAAVFTVNVPQNTAAPSAGAGPDDTLSCSVNTLVINGTGLGSGALTYSWTASGGGNIVSGQNTPAAVVDAPGNYNLLVTDSANGCTSTDAVQIFEDATTPQANAGTAITLTCALTQTTLNATASAGANFTYNWTASAGGNILSGPNTLNPVVNKAGIYTLAVTNTANGCVSTSSVSVPENVTPPGVDAGASMTLTCSKTTLSLAGSASGGNLTYAWQTVGGNIVSGQNTPAPVVNQPGTYTLTATLTTNGCTASDAVQVGIDTLHPVIFTATPGVLTCVQGTVQLNGVVQQQPNVGVTLLWTTAGGHIASGANTLSPIVDAPGTYFFSAQNVSNGCSTIVQTIVNQNITPPTAQAAAPEVITCADPVVSLSGTGSSQGPGFAYSWSGGPITGGQNTLTPTVSAAGPYTLTVTDQSNGCIAIAVAYVSENTAPPNVAVIAPELITCAQPVITLSANLPVSMPDFTASWVSPNGHFVSGQNSLFAVVDKFGTYFLTVINLENGCSTTVQTIASQDITPPGSDAGPSLVLHCNQPAVALQGSSPTAGNLIFNWTTTDGNIAGGANSPTPLADAPGTYQLTVFNPVNGCTSTDAVVVTEIPPPAFTPELILPDCHHPKGAIDLGAVSGGAAPFSYSKDGAQTFVNQPLFNNLPPGMYDLAVRDANGCIADTTVELEAPFLPELQLPEFILIDLGDFVLLEPQLNMPLAYVASWQWSPAEGLSCADCPFPLAQPLRPTVYTLTITDLNGCTAEAEVQLRVDRRRRLYAPNIFSPNGDGLNDTFTLFGKGVTDIRRLQIFDRWGAELFIVEHLEANDETRGWDGTFRGKELNPAVFVWQAVVEFEDGAVEVFAGDITLER